MSGPSFNDFINKFKERSKQAADQMGKAAKIAKLKMDIMTLTGERGRYLQYVGNKAYTLFCETHGLNEEALLDRVRGDLTHIERIDQRMAEIEEQVKDLQAIIQNVEITDVTNPDQEKGGNHHKAEES